MKYKLSENNVRLLNKLFLMKDWNEEDGYSKENVIKLANINRELDSNELHEIRNYVMDKNLEYGFRKDGEPTELGYATEYLSDTLYYYAELEED